jgi:hypothetical protein
MTCNTAEDVILYRDTPPGSTREKRTRALHREIQGLALEGEYGCDE